MNTRASPILRDLSAVDDERAKRSKDPTLGQRVDAVKEYQQRRFARTYRDLLESPRHGAAARFFLDDLYGPGDFSRRDAEFARVVPALVRLFPDELVQTVAALASLHALSESLDTQMAEHLERGRPIDAVAYVQAWQRTASPQRRERQIADALAIARRLDQLTRRPVLRTSLRLMRAPARRAGLGELQHFLETGFDTFRAMAGAEEFIATIDAREHLFARALFAVQFGSASNPSFEAARAQLP